MSCTKRLRHILACDIVGVSHVFGYESVSRAKELFKQCLNWSNNWKGKSCFWEVTYQEAALRPAEFMYQFEQPAEKTDPFNSSWTLSVNSSSAFSFTSKTAARFSWRVLKSVFVTYSTWTSQQNRAELWAGNVLGPNLILVSLRWTGAVKITCQPRDFEILQYCKVGKVVHKRTKVCLSAYIKLARLQTPYLMILPEPFAHWSSRVTPVLPWIFIGVRKFWTWNPVANTITSNSSRTPVELTIPVSSISWIPSGTKSRFSECSDSR